MIDTKGRAPRRAFTLAELLVVVAILGVVAGVAVPAFDRLTNGDGVAAVAADLAMLLERTRLTALREAVAVSVLLDPATGRYTIVRSGRSTTTIADGAITMADARIASAQHRPQVTFHARGTAQGDPIVVRGRGSVRTVRVDPWTGKVAIDAR